MILEIIFFIAAIVLVSRSLVRHQGTKKVVAPKRKNPQATEHLEYGIKLYADHKYLAAEKAFLETLKHDHKSITAYDHLVKIYLALKNYPDAIECAQILSQFEPNAHTYFQLGHVYYENKNFVKAVATFEKSLMFEPSAGRYAALGMCLYKLANFSKATTAFEKAVELEPDRRNLQLLAEVYVHTKEREKLSEVRARLAKLGSVDKKAQKTGNSCCQ